jgi:putative sterol carrier protein
MTAWITQKWLDKHLDLADALPERLGATATICFEVNGDDTVTFTTELSDGRMVSNSLGASNDVDFTMKFTEADFVAMVDGDLDPQVGYMQGRVKVAGNIGRMLSILPITTSEEWRAVLGRLADAT